MNLDEAKQALVDWLDQGREALARSARSLDLPTVVTIQVPVVHDIKNHGSGFGTKHVDETTSVLNVLRYGWAIYDHVQLPSVESIRPALQVVADQFGENCKFFHFYLGQQPIQALLQEKNPTFERSPLEWLVAAIFGPVLLEYASECPDLGKPDKELALALVDQAVEFLAGEVWTVVETIPVAGLLTDSTIRFGNAALIPMSEREMGDWVAMPGRSPTFRHRRWMELSHEQPLATTHRIEIRTEWPKTEQPMPERLAQRLLLALQLMGFRPGSFAYGEQVTEPRWADSSRRGIPTGVSREFEAQTVTKKDLVSAWNLAHKLPESALGGSTSSKDVAIHRYHLALRRPDIVDQLIDLTVALEALLLPGVTTELSFRFRLHGALWIGGSKEERQETFKKLRELYETRSRLIHGEAFPRRELLKAQVEDARELTRKALLKAIGADWPTAETFAGLVIGDK